MNWLARLCALLLLLAPAAVAAQGAQKAYVGEGGGGQASNVPPPPAMEIKTRGQNAPLSSYPMDGDYTVALGPGKPDEPSAVPPPAKQPMTVVQGGTKTYRATEKVIEVGTSFAPDPNDAALKKTTKGLEHGSKVVSVVDVMSSGYSNAAKGDYAAAGQDIAEAAAAEIINQCADRAFDAAVTAACAPTGPYAVPCIAAAKIAKYCVETVLDTDVGQTAVSVAKSAWSEQVATYKRQQAAVAAAQAAISGGSGPCHPNHNETAHPGGCHDYSR